MQNLSFPSFLRTGTMLEAQGLCDSRMTPISSISSKCCFNSWNIPGGIRLNFCLNGRSSVSWTLCFTASVWPKSRSSFANKFSHSFNFPCKVCNCSVDKFSSVELRSSSTRLLCRSTGVDSSSTSTFSKAHNAALGGMTTVWSVKLLSVTCTLSLDPLRLVTAGDTSTPSGRTDFGDGVNITV